MTYKEDMLGALHMIASLHAVKAVTESSGYHIVLFEGTSATITIDAAEVTREEIQEVLDEARS